MARDNPASAAAHIDPGAFVASGAVVHAGAWIGPGVKLATGVVVGPGAVVGFPGPDGQAGPVNVGENTWIGPCAHIEPDVDIGPDSKIGFSAEIRSQSRLGRGVFVGGRCMLVGKCRVGDHAMLYADVHVCEYAVLEESCQIMPGVILLNEPYPPTGLGLKGPTIGRCSVIGVHSLIWPGVRLGTHAMVASMSEVKRDVADYALVRGCPAEFVCDVRDVHMKLDDKWVYPYPWMRHFVPGEDITRRSR
jgi:acetyltransferase-like isoleucine patch superfamily enzyme